MVSSKRSQLAKRLASKEFRQSLKRADIATGVALQVSAMMRERGWNQRKLAAKAGIAAPLISKYLRGYENYSVSTLDKLADAFDVSLAVRFEPYSELVDYHSDLIADSILVPSYPNDRALQEMQKDTAAELQGVSIRALLSKQGDTMPEHQTAFRLDTDDRIREISASPPRDLEMVG